jgi:hypothetical protein
MELARAAEDETNKTAAQWATELEPWDRVVETARSLFGDRWAFYLLANSAAGIKSKTEKCVDCPDLFDTARPLCRRARHARLRSTSVTWWRKQLGVAKNSIETQFVCLQALTWATPSCVIGNIDELERALSSLSENEWHSVFQGVRRAAFWTSRTGESTDWKISPRQLPRRLSMRAACAFAARCDSKVALSIHRKFLAPRLTDDPIILEFAQRDAVDLARFGTDAWSPNLALLRRCYQLGKELDPFLSGRLARGSETSLPINVASEIADDPAQYPAYLVSLAEVV